MGRLVLLVTLLLGALAAPAQAVEWGWPVAGPQAVSRPFDPPATRYAAGHRGADLPSVPGAAVRAAGAGRVSYAGLLAGRGVVVVVHGELRTTYEPVTAAVSVGDVVGLGAVLGTLQPGHAGCPVAACLHWGLRRGDTYLDPVRLVVAGPVRLLPQGAGASGALVGAVGASAPDAAAAPRVQPASAEPVPSAPPSGVWASSTSGEAERVPLGALAVAALVGGIGLLARPRPDLPPPTSPAPAASTSPDAPVPDDLFGGSTSDRPSAPLDLDEARARRRAAS